jgi:hypothetical protein
MKYIFFVTTVASIHDRALQLMEEKRGKGEVIVVVTNDPIEKFFREFSDFTVIRTHVHPDMITRKTKYKIFSNILRSKLEYRRLFKDIKDSEIYFCNQAWAITIYSYIKKLSKNNKLFFYGHWNEKPEKGTITYPQAHGLQAYGMRWIAKWLLGLDTVILNNMGVPFWKLDDSFFKNITILDNYTWDHTSADKYAKKFDFLKGKKILIAVEDSVAAGTIAEPEFTTKMDHMMDIIQEVAPEGYIIKPHPRLDKLYGKMAQSHEVVPSYIPIEFILGHPWKAVIGINSWSVSQAAKMTDAKAISLIDAIHFNDENIKTMFRDWLDRESNQKIEFLHDVDELKAILKESLKKPHKK